MSASFGRKGKVGGFQGEGGGEIGDGEEDGVEDTHRPGGGFVQDGPSPVLETFVLDDILIAGDTDVLAEGIEDVRGVATAAKTLDGGHAGVVPALDLVTLDELEEFALGEDGVGDVQPGEFIDLWPVELEGFQDPVV